MSQNLQYSQIQQHHIFDAKVYVRQGDISNSNESMHKYNIAIRLNPKCYQAFIQKGILLNRQKYIDEAIQMFDKAQEINPQDKQIYKNKGNIYRDLKNFDKALEFYEIAVKLDDADVDNYLQKGKILFAQGKIEEAIQLFALAMKYNPNSYEYSILGNKLFDEKKYKEALIMLDMVIKLDPKKGYVDKGKKLIALGEIQEAFLLFNEALKFDPYSDEYKIIGDKFYDEKKYEEALIIYDMLIIINRNQGFQRKVRTLITLGRMEEAFQQFIEAMKQNDKYWKYQERGNQIFSDYEYKEKIYEMSINFRIIQSQLLKVKTILASEKMQEAYQIFTDNIKYDPYHWEYQEIGDQFLADQKYEEAFIMYDASIRKQNSGKGYIGKGRLFVALEKQQRNINKFLQAIKYVPSFYNYEQVGDLFFDDKQYEEAFILCDMLIKINPTKGHLIKGIRLITLGKMEEAQLIFESIDAPSKLDSYELRQYSKLGDKLFYEKQYDKAYKIYDIIKQYQPRYGYIHKGKYEEYFQAKKLFELGKNEEAFSLLNEGIKYDPPFYEYQEIGDQFINKIKYDEAFFIYDMLIKLVPIQGSLLKGKVLIKLGQMQEAFQVFNEAIQYKPSILEYLKIGDQFFSENKYEEALIIYDMLIKLDPKQGFLVKGKALIQLGQMEEAFQVLNEGIKYAPSFLEYQKLGNSFLEQQKYEEGLIIYDMIIKLDPKKGYLEKGKKLIAIGKNGEAFEIFNQAIKYNPLPDEYYSIGNQLFDDKKYEESLILYDLSLKLDSNMGYLGKAKALIALGNIDDAFSILNENKSQLSNLRFSNKGDKRFDQKKYEEAITMYHLISPPQSGFFLKGKTFIAMKNFKAAFQMFNEALKYDPVDEKIFLLGDLFFYQKQYQEAFIIYDERIKFDPQMGYLAKGLKLMTLGKTEEAQIQFNEYTKNDRSQWEILNIGDLLYERGQYEEAFIMYDIVSKYDKYDPQEIQLRKISTFIAWGKIEEALQMFDETRKSLEIDTIFERIPNLGYFLYVTRQLEPIYMNPNYFQLENPFQYHKDLILQELGLYDVQEDCEIKYILASQLENYK